MTRHILLLVFGLLFVKSCLSQDTTAIQTVTKASFKKAYFKSYFTDTKDIIAAPLGWNGRQWLTAGTLLTVTSIFVTQDKNTRDVFQKNKNNVSEKLSLYVFEPWGNNYSFALIAGVYFEGLLFKNERSKMVAMNGAKSIILTGLFTQISKYIIQRHRPYQDNPADPYNADGPFHGFSNHRSFFSGHTSTAFALATTLSLEYKEKKWLPFVAYTIATGTALSRIYDDEHWASDVFFGAAAGYLIAEIIYKKNNWGIKLEPISSQKEKGLKLTYCLK